MTRKFNLYFEKQMHCWKGYKKKGTKKLPSGKVVNNCVKESVLEENRIDRLEQTLNNVLDIIQERYPDLYKEIISVQSPDDLRSLLKNGEKEQEGTIR